MISVVTSVYKKEVYESFSKNLAATTGVVYELIGIDNSDGSMGLCEVYNKGAGKAQYDIICFAHEDILIRTPQWGQIILGIFADNEQLGLIGVAGSSYKPAVPSGWSYPYATAATTFMNIVESSAGRSEPVYCNPDNARLSKVVCIDGLWFCTRKKIMEKIRFDETTFRRFHCYDVDFSLAVSRHYEVAVTFDILIEHFSAGSFNAEWIGETLKLHRKWKQYLPVNAAGLNAQTQKNEELGSLYFMLRKCVLLHFPARKLLVHIWSRRILSILGWKTFLRVNQKMIMAGRATVQE